MKHLSRLLQDQFDRMQETGRLFRASISGHALWDLYLASFQEGEDPVFRDPTSSTHKCNNCANFIHRYGNIVALDENLDVMTIWDVEPEKELLSSVRALAAAVRGSDIQGVFTETFDSLNKLPYEACKKSATAYRLGVASNAKVYTQEEADKFGVVKPGEARTFHHMHLSVNSAFVNMGGQSIEAIVGQYRDAKQVFQRAMEEIPLDTLNLVRDLINQGSLLNGSAHLFKVEAMIPLKRAYDALPAAKRDAWCWDKSYDFPQAKFRNELIGVLCTELAEGKELNAACKAWNIRVDPVNYMKASAPITAQMIEQAKQFCEENGYVQSFARRLATIDDIRVSEILHVNVGDGKIKGVSIFDSVKAVSTRHKRSEFDGVEEVPIDRFMENILPGCSSVEVFVSNGHDKHFVTLTTSDENSKPIFKWDNPYSWTFNGNLAGKSQLADRVVSKGGRVDGVFRFTHSWNELEPNTSLMDLHVFMPGCEIPKQGSGGPNVRGRRVGWNQRKDHLSGGTQDVDYVDQAPKGYIPVENITFPDLAKMPEGVYTCAIHNWSFRGSGGKGRCEIAFAGELHEYIYPETKNHQWVMVAEVTLKDGVFSIRHLLTSADTPKDIYGITTNEFHRVNLICTSPNHWGSNNVGNKHYFFFLEGCKVPTSIRGFHVENLIPELAKHRKVLEVLGATTMIQPGGNQLSGLGFNATVRDEVVLRLQGTHKRVIRLKF